MELRNWRVGLVAGAILVCGIAAGVAGMPPGSAAASEKADASASAEASAAADGEAGGGVTASGMQTDAYGVVDAKEWADTFPLEYNSYLMNAKNVPGDYQAFLDAGGVDTWSVGLENVTDFASDKADYLVKYPEIKTLGKGYGYAKYYTEPAGHTYALWTVANNGRLGPLEESKGSIACYTCKTPQIHYAAAAAGEDVGTDYWTQPISEHAHDFDENISCANCHENDNMMQLQVLRADWNRAMGDDAQSVPLEGQVCGQCHCDYSMAPANPDDPFNDGEPISPYYGGLDSMTPENALAFYDEYGFADWTYESTGAKMLAVRHAEFEFNYANGENPMVRAMGYNCNDCHMPKKTDADSGMEYTSHYWVSPLDDDELLAECNTCHGDLTTEIHDLQADIDGRTHVLGLRAEQFVHNFESQVGKETDDGAGGTKLVFDMDTAKANGLSEDQVARLQQIQRYACYYWNLASAENSEGAHNPKFYNYLIDKGNELLDEADDILEMDSHVSD